MDIKTLFTKLINGNLVSVSKAITLVESTHPSRTVDTAKLMNYVYRNNKKNDNKKTFRLGISGPPGAGKSTFIDRLASYLLAKDNDLRVSVLTVDPSSPKTGGSLLADSLRMDTLTHLSDPSRIFVRSTPSSGHLGGVHRRTPFAIQLLEAAGFNVVLVETVGAGQNEVSVADMVDCFLVLIPPAAGDEFQAIKKGIVEMADVVAITKNDLGFIDACKQTYRDYLSSMNLFPPKSSTWKPALVQVSAKTGEGIPELWEKIVKFQDVTQAHGYFARNRNRQFEKLFLSEVDNQLHEAVYSQEKFRKLSNELQEKVASGEIWPANAAHDFIKEVFRREVD